MEKRASPLKLIVLVVVLLAGAAAGFWWLRIHDYNVRFAIDDGIAVLRAAGPFAFFTAMALLPVVGAPISVFNLTAASAFGAQMGLSGVILAAGAAIAVNLSLTYWLARYALRPWLEEIIGRTKYKIPEVSEESHAEITVLLRITPGPPLFLQSCLLGLARIRFVTYFWISWVISFIYSVAFIVFGEAILQGRGKVAFIGLSVLVAIGLGVNLLRRYYARKRT